MRGCAVASEKHCRGGVIHKLTQIGMKCCT